MKEMLDIPLFGNHEVRDFMKNQNPNLLRSKNTEKDHKLKVFMAKNGRGDYSVH